MATITILYSTQSGRAKACARRSSRLLKAKYPSIDIHGNCSFDDFGAQNFLSIGTADTNAKHLLLLFVSTTGDGEHTTTITKTWHALLSKTLPTTLFANVSFALFALGDRAYGDAFCAAGRKLAARLVQLGASPKCALGYGDDGSGAGVLGDLDVWLGENLFGVVDGLYVSDGNVSNQNNKVAAGNDGENDSLYLVQILSQDLVSDTESPQRNSDGLIQEWQESKYKQQYAEYFQHSCPDTAYQYNDQCVRLKTDKINNDTLQHLDVSHNIMTPRAPPLLGCVTANDRITSEDWMQNTRHLRIHVTTQMRSTATSTQRNGQESLCSLPYQAGDVATILPSNPTKLVSTFISILPPSIRALADKTLQIERIRPDLTSTNHPWPELCTLRGLLTHCADLQSLPEQEDLYALSAYCNLDHANGIDQRDKLISLSETSGAALYADYIIRNKRNWVDLFYDFDSLFYEVAIDEDTAGSKNVGFAISSLLTLLPSIAPRHFSIASSPSFTKLKRPSDALGFELELCVAVVEGTTSLGRSYSGCCSSHLATETSPKTKEAATNFEMNRIRLWITPGSFHQLPLDRSPDSDRLFRTPILCVGAGTGIAPLRSLLLEREAAVLSSITQKSHEKEDVSYQDNILVFGCRKRSMDYYYGAEWESLVVAGRLRLTAAFSRDQTEKLYVQRALREMDRRSFITKHILEHGGAVYIAGGSKMARAVKDEIVTALGAVLEGGDADARKLLNRLKRRGLFSIEAWN